MRSSCLQTTTQPCSSTGPKVWTRGFRTVLITDLDLADGDDHTLLVSLYGNELFLFVDGNLHLHSLLVGPVEDGPGSLLLGTVSGSSAFFSGLENDENIIKSPD